MKKSLIIHGHFYQPPRENPFSGIIHQQSSAYPSENWNESIFQSCYLANANSRFLSYDGRIKDIDNNYKNISFNFGPTLLSWIKQYHPELLFSLVNADKDSIAKLGHGNAIAQGYNHTILPLDSPRIRHLEVYWGIKSFEEYFSRAPEGFWCPECAINTDVIDELADNGIKYTILSPWQAESVEGKLISGTTDHCREPYIIEGTGGRSIAAFFYDPSYAADISFNHLLKDADSLYNNVEKTFKETNTPLLQWATDGEIYGHHEPFGDMALCALIKKIQENDELQMSNYGAYLEEHPPVKIAKLKEGDDKKGTSWSCSHGVGRWFRDCGCHTGGKEGWNQKWRTPLRTAFNNLGDKIMPLFDSQINSIFDGNKTSTELLEEYWLVTSEATTMETFVESHNLTEEKCHTLARLLDGITNYFYTYTSCGWFFSDIGGIEPRHNISNAVYATSVFDDFTDQNLFNGLLEDLQKAKSNEKIMGDGKKLALSDNPVRPAYITAAGFYFFNRMLAEIPDYARSYGFFFFKEINQNSVTIIDTHTLEKHDISLVFNENKILVATDRNTNEVFKIDTDEVSPWAKKQFSTWIENSLERGITDSFIKHFSKDIMKYLLIINNVKEEKNHAVILENRGLCLKCIRYILNGKTEFNWFEKTNILTTFISFVKLDPTEEHLHILQSLFDKACNELAIEISLNTLTNEMAEDILTTVKIARTNGFQPRLTEIQAAVLPYLAKKKYGHLQPTYELRMCEDLNFSLSAQ